MLDATYILPLRRATPEVNDEFCAYLQWLARRVHVVVVDNSPQEVFAAHAFYWGQWVQHLQPDHDLRTPNGKVGNVVTGIRHAPHERLVIADDDVRYDDAGLVRLVNVLDVADVVRPQNYFEPLPWHALWDTGRTLLNRMMGGDWPGTLGVRRSVLLATNGYAGDVLFENLELVRTVRAAGGVEAVLPDLYVQRLPPSNTHFWSQRVRQAYDEFARPLRMAMSLMVLPLMLNLVLRRRWTWLLAAVGGIIGVAEMGRWRAGGRRVFPFAASLLAPAWVGERAVCSWLALGSRIMHGGVRYGGGVLPHAATPMPVLRKRYAHVHVRGAHAGHPIQQPTPPVIGVPHLNKRRDQHDIGPRGPAERAG
jgi:hypothetical protein